MNPQEGAQLDDLFVARRVWVHADGPDAAGPFDWSPKLLWDPCHPVDAKWHARKTIRQKINSFRAKRLERARIEAMPGSDPNPGIQAVAAQNVEPGANPCMLRRCVDAGKFGSSVKAKNTAA